jgi:enamine deaminase RidA (YjgF/YER057c/UK114 family)
MSADVRDSASLEFLHPAGWAAPRGYANGVAATGRIVFVGGQIGWNPSQQFESHDFVAQARQALANVVAVLAEAGARPEHIARMTWYVVDKREYLASGKALGAAYREIMGRHYPAMTAVEVKSLMEDAARVEIEATAVIPDLG